MKTILLNEWRGFYRNKLFLIIILFFSLSLFLTTTLSISQSKKQINSQIEAKEHIRNQWDSMDSSNPHKAAHFGSYAFKPINILSSLDEGVNSVTGNVLRLEGHVQNDVIFSENSQSLLISKFGKLKPSLLFQFIIPLFLIFLTFNNYIKDKESGRLKLILVQGASLKDVLFSKLYSIWIIGISLLFFTMLIQLTFSFGDIDFDILYRLLFVFLCYSLYYFIIINLTLLLSFIFNNATASLSIMIIIWIMWTVFLPKIIGNAVENISPLPTRVDFNNSMSYDRSKGIDGHNPTGIRRQELEDKILSEYNVAKIEDLPINFTGVLMQADEEYGNKVWDKHFGNLYDQLKSQKKYYQLSGFINPFSSLQNISMGLSGSDMFHHLDFLSQAENYRRFLIKQLNDEYAFGGSVSGDRSWKASKEFFQSIEDFNYNFPSFFSFLNKYLIDVFVLFFWFFMLIYLLVSKSRKMTIL